jgi:hypothetical protein
MVRQLRHYQKIVTGDVQRQARCISAITPKYPGKDNTMDATTRSLAEKQARIKTIADTMDTLRYLNLISQNRMGDFSQDEAGAFHDTVDALNHFVTLASVNT